MRIWCAVWGACVLSINLWIRRLKNLVKLLGGFVPIMDGACVGTTPHPATVTFFPLQLLVGNPYKPLSLLLGKDSDSLKINGKIILLGGGFNYCCMFIPILGVSWSHLFFRSYPSTRLVQPPTSLVVTMNPGAPFWRIIPGLRYVVRITPPFTSHFYRPWMEGVPRSPFTMAINHVHPLGWSSKWWVGSKSACENPRTFWFLQAPSAGRGARGAIYTWDFRTAFFNWWLSNGSYNTHTLSTKDDIFFGWFYFPFFGGMFFCQWSWGYIIKNGRELAMYTL